MPHVDRQVRGVVHAVVECVNCGDRFPCKTTGCGHADCDEVRADPNALRLYALRNVP